MTRDKRKLPDGPPIRITEAWQARVDAELEEKGIDRLGLANAIGASSGGITNLLTPGRQVTSRLVQPVCDYLQIPLPQYQDERDAEAIEIIRKLRDEHPRRFDELVERARKFLAENG